MTLRLPNFIAVVYLKLSSGYQKAHAIIERYLCRMMEQEMAQNKEFNNEKEHV